MANDALTMKLEPEGRAIVDGNFEETSGGKATWRLHSRTASRPRAYTYFRIRGKYTKVFLERFVMKVPNSTFVRFLNKNTLDCRRANLKVVETRRESFALDWEQWQRWDLEEGYNGPINPQRRREDAWRMWCEGSKVDKNDNIDSIARRLRSDAKTIRRDIRAMAEDPLAAMS